MNSSPTQDVFILIARRAFEIFEGLKENSTIVIVPSTAIETMQLGGLAGMTALTMGLGQERAGKEKESELKSNNGANKIPSTV